MNPKRNCVRCGAELHMSAEHQPHLCADIAKRLKRRTRQVNAVLDVLVAQADLDRAMDHSGLADGDIRRAMAETIVAKLANLGVEDD